ncbi:MAG: hypothetical protein KC431_06765, partial [Myxococcales bacterium]|nr:hypothetical protein [Myxococcales bacterium]
MDPSNSDIGSSADHDDDLLAPAMAEDDEHEAEQAEIEDDDGLAPEAGRRSPSLLSLLLLAAGAIWIVVAMLKLGDGDGSEGMQAAAIQDLADDGGQLPNVDEAPPASEDGTAFPGEETAGQDPSPELAAESGSESAADDPELAPGPGDGDPASERGPPQESLLAGKVWPRDYAAPEIVHYTIKRGGSMKVVA